jgi:hypothetical protein
MRFFERSALLDWARLLWAAGSLAPRSVRPSCLDRASGRIRTYAYYPGEKGAAADLSGTAVS